MQFFWGGALISCSNGSSSSDEDDDESSYRTKIYSNSITFNAETPVQIVSAETLAELNIKSLTIKVINVNYSGSDDWWFTACSDSSWSNETKLEWQSGEETNSLYIATITDTKTIAAYKANGIYIAGTNGATASVSVFYVEGESESTNSNDDESTYGKKIYSGDVTFTSDRIEIVSSEKISSIANITCIEIKVTNLSDPNCWITLYATNAENDWITGKYEIKGEDWHTSEATYKITDIETYKNRGIYIQGTKNITGTVTVSYE